MTASTQEISAFLQHETDLLDDRRFRDWLALFAPSAYYWIPVNPRQLDPNEAPSLVFEQWPVLAARIERLYDPRIVPQRPPSLTSRILGPVRIVDKSADGTIIARAKFHLVEARATHDLEDELRVFAGTTTFNLSPTTNGFSIVWKRVDLINSESAMRGVSIIF
jgi:ethylbenzene dioxygenase subunit beta